MDISNPEPEFEQLVDDKVKRLWAQDLKRRHAAQQVAQIDEAVKCALTCLLPAIFIVIFFWD